MPTRFFVSDLIQLGLAMASHSFEVVCWHLGLLGRSRIDFLRQLTRPMLEVDHSTYPTDRVNDKYLDLLGQCRVYTLNASNIFISGHGLFQYSSQRWVYLSSAIVLNPNQVFPARRGPPQCMWTSESEVRLQSRATTEKFPIRKAKRRTSRANGQKGQG